ncbi:MAG: helix-turn-helix transcriptional regulator [Flavobacteriales bacterium]|jgi:DNA-binding Xre family transcriptional regulator|nr:helix-turn-helix transcriptional regulator [Flavobacteriales bacterium]
MLQTRIIQVAQELGIKNLHSHLRKKGLSRFHATEISQGRLQKFDLPLLYKLCQAFKCTLNDLIQYVPANEEELEQQSFLQPMVIEHAPIDVSRKLENLDNDKRKLLLEFLDRL